MNNQKILDWYQKELEKDKVDIENNKKKLIQSIKKVKKDDIFDTPKKMSLWMRIKMVLMGI